MTDLGTLRSRLARARELARQSQFVEKRGTSSTAEGTEVRGLSKQGEESADVLAGWTAIAPFVQFRTLRRPNPLPPVLDLRPYLGRSALRALAVEEEHGHSEGSVNLFADLRAVQAEHLRFFDLETTGLSEGAGTVAFLAGFGRVASGPGGEELEIRQYFISDYPGEGYFLDAILGELESGVILASYNGRSFDEPLLKTRCVLNRRAWPPFLHADFLHAARRLWRGRFPDCSLGTLEERLLGRSRSLDVPGARIPEIWLEYVRKGEHPLMPAVVEHNAADIESLAAIAAECARIHRDPEKARGCDRTALGSLWLGLDAARGTQTLEGVFSEGDQRAGWMLLRHYRRAGRIQEYERILSALSPSWESWIEKAKHAEHRGRDAEGALVAAHEAEAYAAKTALREALERRLARLEKKLLLTRLREGRRDRPH